LAGEGTRPPTIQFERQIESTRNPFGDIRNPRTLQKKEPAVYPYTAGIAF
jgi:hypothetical protein